MTIIVKRSGTNARKWTIEASNVRVLHNLTAEAVSLRCEIPSKGGGTTVVQLDIKADSFEAIAEAMWQVDENAAIRAFGAALVIAHSTDPDPED